MMPRSMRKPRIWSITPVRWLTRREQHAMQSQQIHLLGRLDRHKMHGWPLHRFRNRLRIAVVVHDP
jgi:hypothetical protein